MQEEIEQKSFNIMISTTKLSARTVLRAVKAAFRLYQSKTSQGTNVCRNKYFFKHSFVCVQVISLHCYRLYI